MVSRTRCTSSDDEELVDSSFSVLNELPKFNNSPPPSLNTASMNETKQGERYEQRQDIVEVLKFLH